MGSQGHTAFLGAGSRGWQLEGQQGITRPLWSLTSWRLRGVSGQAAMGGAAGETPAGGGEGEGAGSSVGGRAALGHSRPRVPVMCVGHLEERKPTKQF